jgi:hypothetical protein
MKKIIPIFANAVPIFFMIGLIPFVRNDYLLALVYVVVIAISFAIKKIRNDLLVFVFGFFIMLISEYVFVSTGVETFTRNSLFSIMPVWLPVLWAYGFVAMKRAIKILES